jgi:hypothetical protein
MGHVAETGDSGRHKNALVAMERQEGVCSSRMRLSGGAEKSSQKSQDTSLSNGLSHAVLSSPGSQTNRCLEKTEAAPLNVSPRVMQRLLARAFRC